jgi:tRNA-(ms[2]io[6]A)-hydroxylase
MMFRLQLPSDPRWVDIAKMNESEILTDHAYCEQKAASTAISLIVRFYDYPQIVSKMAHLAKEEIEHFKRVHEFILKRGYQLGMERKDEYVNQLIKFIKKGSGRQQQLIDNLLMAALIEARSCERFKWLSEQIPDPELAAFYRELMESEAGHYTMFITLAREIAPRSQVDLRWKEILDFEAIVIDSLGNKQAIHG